MIRKEPENRGIPKRNQNWGGKIYILEKENSRGGELKTRQKKTLQIKGD